MAYYRFQLKAGVPFPASVSGRVLLIDDLGGASGLDITPNYSGRDLPKMPDRKKAFKFMEPFDGVTLTAPVDCNVGLFLSANDVSLGFADGSAVSVSSGQITIANTAAARVPVDLAGGTVTVNAANVGINNTDAAAVPVRPRKLATLVNLPAVAVGTALVAVVSDVAMAGLRFYNASATAVIYLGGATVTAANAAIQLQPGDYWIEEDAPGAAWFAVASEAGELRVMGVKV